MTVNAKQVLLANSHCSPAFRSISFIKLRRCGQRSAFGR
jgi:hypothetical protein